MTWQDNGERASFLPRREIGEFTATITIDEQSIDELAITSFPVQHGAEITDHAHKKPASVTVHVMWSADDEPLSETYRRLIELQESRIPFDVVTGKRQYKNMLMEALRQTTDARSENVLDISMTMREINIVSVETVSVAESTSAYASDPAQQEFPEKTSATGRAGKKQVLDTKQEEGAGSTQSTRRRSALATLAGR